MSVAVTWGSPATLALGRHAPEDGEPGQWAAGVVRGMGDCVAAGAQLAAQAPLSRHALLQSNTPRRAPGALLLDEPFHAPANVAEQSSSRHVDVTDVACGWGHSVFAAAPAGAVAVCGRPLDFQSTVRAVKMGGRGSKALLAASRWVGATVFGDDLGALRPALVTGSAGSAGSALDGPESCAAGAGALSGVVTSDGRILMAGYDVHGQCGLATDGKEATVAAFGETAMPRMFQESCSEGDGDVDSASAAGGAAGGGSAVSQGAAWPGMADTQVWEHAGASGFAVDLALGFHHAVAMDDEGALWAWGKGGRGEIGDGTVETRRTPRLIVAPALRRSLVEAGKAVPGAADAVIDGRAVAVAAGFRHTAAILDDGRAIIWGRLQSCSAGSGQTRPGPADDAKWPRLVTMPVQAPAVAVACGQAHTAFLCADGSICVMGLRGAGLQADATGAAEASAGHAEADGAEPMSAADVAESAEEGGPWASADIVAQPVVLCSADALLRAAGDADAAVMGADGVAQLACGASHVYAVSRGGKVARVGWRGVAEPVEPLNATGLAVRRLSLGIVHGAAVVELAGDVGPGASGGSGGERSAGESGNMPAAPAAAAETAAEAAAAAASTAEAARKEASTGAAAAGMSEEEAAVELLLQGHWSQSEGASDWARFART